MALQDIVVKGTTGYSVPLRALDSDGQPYNSLAWNTSGIDLWYRRERSAQVAITEATLAGLTTAHAAGGFILVDDGGYSLDLPDAALASAAGVRWVDYGGTAPGLTIIGGRVRLSTFDLDTATAPLATDGISAAALSTAAVDKIKAAILLLLNSEIPDSIPAVGTRVSLYSGVYMISQFLFKGAVAGNTYTVKKPDGTTLFTLTLNDGTQPTSISRAT